MVLDIAVSSDHKAKSTAGRVKALVAQLGFDELRHHIDQHTRGEVLAGTRLLLVGVFLQKTFIQVAQTFLFGLISVCSAGTKKSRTIFAQLILYVIRLRVYLYVSD